jgi:hypothetical protein
VSIDNSMSIERKNPLKREQALNDATSGQMGEQPRPQPSKPIEDNLNEQRIKAARKISRDLWSWYIFSYIN